MSTDSFVSFIADPKRYRVGHDPIVSFKAPPTNWCSSHCGSKTIDSCISDEHLISAVAHGKKDALSTLFERFGPKALRIAFRILNDSAEAEDLVQDLFIFIFQKARLFDPAKSSASSWIIQMAYHRAIDRRRYLGVRQHYDMRELDADRHTAPTSQVSIDELAGRALLSKLQSELSAEQLQTLELHFFEGYTLQEIATRTSQTYGNVRHHYYRGLERLRAYVFPEKAARK